MFGEYAGSGTGSSVTVNNLNGDQTYDIDNWAARNYGNFSIVTGIGSSSFNFGDQAATDGGRIDLDLDLDLGLDLDTDADSASFDGPVGNIFIQNYSITYDDKVDVLVPSTWSGTDNGTDIVFTQSDQTITFEGLGGVGGPTDQLDYFM